MRRILTALRRKIAALGPRRPVLVPVPVRRPAPQRGLTLVEMLITVAITLIMMAAVVNVFASIGQSVQHRRSTIEMSNQLRIARTLLAQDLSRATATTLPPRDPSSGEGYIELIEGIHTDWYPTRLTDGSSGSGVDATGNSEIDASNPSIVPPAALASDSEVLVQQVPAPPPYAYGQLGLSGLGDFDDILALTVRSEGEPFVGRFGTTTIKSHEAEVIWYAVENPAVPTDHPLYLGEPGMRTIYRRVLLIAPWADIDPTSPTSLTMVADSLGIGLFNATDPEAWRTFYRNFDVSVRVDPETGRWVPNTLADLTKRENRFAHLAVFPHTMDVRRIRHTDPAVYSSSVNPSDKSPTPLVPFGTAMEYDEAPPSPPSGFGTENTRLGEDVVLTNVLAFDLRVFDPGAPITALVSGGSIVPGTVVDPSEAGRLVLPPTVSPSNVVGKGAYVDLAYLRDPPPSATYDSGSGVTSQFSGPPAERAGFNISAGAWTVPQNDPRFLIRATYDTWSFHYEYDGINQDGDTAPLSNIPLVDEGTNGVNNLSGAADRAIDSINEWETLPPYLAPLRGIEVKLRIYEPDSRVLREVSVKQNFTPQ